MNFWVCPSCGKKVAETIKSCPHCKALRQQEIKIVTESNTKHYKVALAALSIIIIAGGFYSLGKSKADPAKPSYLNKSDAYQPKIIKAVNKKELPPAAIEAFKAFKKMQARTQVGISHRDYSDALAEVRLAFNMYNESTASKELPELTATFKKAYQGYDFAKEIWKEKFSGSKIDNFTPKDQFNYIFAVFPDAEKEVKDGGIISKDLYPGKDYIYIEAAIPFLFSAANEQIQKASQQIER